MTDRDLHHGHFNVGDACLARFNSRNTTRHRNNGQWARILRR
ncbi:MAG: hypothetical protein QNJ22_21675 [Desulfosarcinaceae bacterium]|nr:hypothetical protein [Desulfosarcinaceae bacterium]